MVSLFISHNIEVEYVDNTADSCDDRHTIIVQCRYVDSSAPGWFE